MTRKQALVYVYKEHGTRISNDEAWRLAMELIDRGKRKPPDRDGNPFPSMGHASNGRVLMQCWERSGKNGELKFAGWQCSGAAHVKCNPDCHHAKPHRSKCKSCREGMCRHVGKRVACEKVYERQPLTMVLTP